jgi:hypothetical protein
MGGSFSCLFVATWEKERVHFCEQERRQARVGQFDDNFKERLSRARAEKTYLFDPTVNIGEVYSLGRLLQRGSTSAATNSGVTQDIVELNNWWRKVEQSRGRKLLMSMAAHYTEIKLMLPTLWKCSSSF